MAGRGNLRIGEGVIELGSYGQLSNEGAHPEKSPQQFQAQPSQNLKAKDRCWSHSSWIYEEIFLTDDMPNLVEYLCPHDPGQRSLWAYVWLSIIVTLRGVSQVYLCAHPVTAIFICIALGLSSGAMLAYALIGSAVSSLSAHVIMKSDAAKVKNGLCGYDGVLASLAVYVFLANGKSDDEVYHTYGLIPLVVALSVACGIIREAAAHVMNLAHLPPFTLTFNVVTMCVLVAVTRGTVTFAHWKTSTDPPAADWSQLSVMFFVDSVFRGMGQLIFCDSTLGGGLITLGLFIGHQRGCIVAFLGSVLGSLTTLYICRVPYFSRPSIRSGLFGYNSCAVAIVIGGGRFYEANTGTAFVVIIGSILCILFQAAMSGIFFVDGRSLPMLTFPFLMTVWIMMASQSHRFFSWTLQRVLSAANPLIQMEFPTLESSQERQPLIH